MPASVDRDRRPALLGQSPCALAPRMSRLPTAMEQKDRADRYLPSSGFTAIPDDANTQALESNSLRMHSSDLTHRDACRSEGYGWVMERTVSYTHMTLPTI